MNHIDGPVLVFAGAEDSIWAGYLAAPQIVNEMSAADNRYPHQDVVYPNAGHIVGTYPYVPVTNEGGGTVSGNAAARADSWARLLAFLAADHS